MHANIEKVMANVKVFGQTDRRFIFDHTCHTSRNVRDSPGNEELVPLSRKSVKCPGIYKIHIYMYLILGLTAPQICVYLQRLHDNAYPNR
ncbi:hypothetical protein DPMN_053513 [Dreissena polymorpha]|uniref:Uncharacterized protein n=1 Tax=Dreissena polymorpha TaxID=45954 RepID=A0A9D4CMX8_DREPO|nr:hypothetical protein DPMN_053513 [Dreissena polymorpha]